MIRKPEKAGERVAALGTFDGVHAGHRQLLRTALDYALDHGIPLRVCTFDRHPLEVICPDSAPPLLTTLPEKAVELMRCGANETELICFDRQEADMEPEAFLASLRERMKLRAVVAGWNYTFGKKGRGNAQLLQEDGKRYGYDVLIEPPATQPDGTVISSTLVRQLLTDGRPEKAAELLCRPYSLTGTVVTGKREGHLLGYPTANIQPYARKALPAYGVYTCRLETAEDSRPAVVNIGVTPTLPSGRVTVEAYALTGHPDLYGHKVRLTLLSMLRRETKFENQEELVRQIDKDRDEALRFFDMA